MRDRMKRVTFLILKGGFFLFFIIGCTTVTFDKEIVQFFSKVRSQPGNPGSHYLLACYYQERGRHKEAIEEFKKVILINPDHIKAYNGMGVSYDLLEKFPEAVESYKTALRLNPNLDYVHNNLGYSYLLQERFQDAILAFNRAIVLNDSNRQTHNNLGLAYAETDQFDLALMEFKKAGDDSKAHYNMAQVCLKKGLYSEAKGHYAKALDFNPSVTVVRTGLEAAHVLARIFLPIPVKAERNDWVIPDKGNIEKEGSEIIAIEDQNTFLKATNAKEEVNDPSKNENGAPEDGRDPDRVTVIAMKQVNPEESTTSGQPVTGELKKQENLTPDQRVDTKQQNSFREVGIEISNGNGANRMARRVGDYLKEKGFPVVRLTNANHFNHPETQIYFYKGHGDEARQVAEQIIFKLENMRELKQLERANVKIKVVIGKDLISQNKSSGDPKS
jgi:tetratricopeptide (TPR) repeat protein